jgi:hypothetical protein
LNTFNFLLDKAIRLPYAGVEHVQLNMFKKTGGIMYIIVCYLTYLAISLGVTIWVARTLHRNGRVFLVDAFQGNAELADSVNHLLVVGFYLINVGYVTVTLRTTTILSNSRQAIELVCDKIGVVLLVLGIMHFFNLYVFNQLRKRARERNERPLPPAERSGWRPAGAPIGKVLE